MVGIDARMQAFYGMLLAFGGHSPYAGVILGFVSLTSSI